MIEQLLPTKNIYGETLVKLGNRNKDIYVVEADLMKASGSKPFQERFPNRHINVGIAEQNLVSVAAGIAAAGGIPFACTMANFLAKRACDQVAISVAYNKFNVKLVGIYAGLTQEKNGGTHVSFMDIAIFRAIPNMIVLDPGDCEELVQVLQIAAELDGPVYIHLNKLLLKRVGEEHTIFELGKGRQIGTGNDVTIVSSGLTTGIALEAQARLVKIGVATRVLHFATIKPFDSELLFKAARETGIIITIENHGIIGGLGSLVAELLTSVSIPVQVYRLGLNDTFGLTAPLEFQLKYFGITANKIENIVKDFFLKKR